MNRDHCNRFSSIVSLYFFFLVSFDRHILASSTLENCRHDQRDFLMELKDEFSTNDTSLSSWTNETDCCSWEGVTCNAKTGQVISLDLNFNVLNNSLKQNSALFKFQQLRVLNLGDCNLFGKLPSSLGNLSRLVELDLSYNQFVGEVPSSIGNLNQLSHMRLDGNNFTGNIPISFANFTNLSQLDISHNQFIGNFPLLILPNLTSLSSLHISSNHFDSSLPSDMTTLHNLESFSADENSISGDFPSSLFMIPSLTLVSLEGNQFKGHIAFSNTSSSSKLRFLHLARNKLDGPILDYISNFLNLEVIDLSHNDFTGPIPLSISKLVNLNLTYLGLSNNKLEGEIPNFLWGLEEVTLSHNFFSSFGESSQVPNETLILALDLSSNSLQGPFPEWICKLGPLRLLDLSNNLLNGSIPRCLNFTSYLNELILHNNSLTGVVPDIFSSATGLHTLDVSRNQLQGKIPKSLINCKAMEFLNVERNRIKDEFPSWLGSLPSLHVLFLRSNQFYGPLYHPNLSVVRFQNLSVIDISDNDFNGTLPPYYFSSWSQMRTITIEVEDDITYLGKEIRGMYSMIGYKNSMEMVNKGVETEFERIRKDFRAIDFSGNRLCGKIPESIGLLKELRYLNLSGNAFTGNILSSLANITNLETLDLSRNKLSGHIPSELGNLSFLSNINFSHNNLQGPVPRGTQFQSQKCSSFMDNPKLYGLEDICGDAHVPNPTSQQSEELSELEEQVFSWIAAAIAYGPGVFCGLVLGHIFASHKHQWFTEKFH